MLLCVVLQVASLEATLRQSLLPLRISLLRSTGDTSQTDEPSDCQSAHMLRGAQLHGFYYSGCSRYKEYLAYAVASLLALTIFIDYMYFNIKAKCHAGTLPIIHACRKPGHVCHRKIVNYFSTQCDFNTDMHPEQRGQC